VHLQHILRAEYGEDLAAGAIEHLKPEETAAAAAFNSNSVTTGVLGTHGHPDCIA
jgi:hypothetical protein